MGGVRAHPVTVTHFITGPYTYTEISYRNPIFKADFPFLLVNSSVWGPGRQHRSQTFTSLSIWGIQLHLLLCLEKAHENEECVFYVKGGMHDQWVLRIKSEDELLQDDLKLKEWFGFNIYITHIYYPIYTMTILTFCSFTSQLSKCKTYRKFPTLVKIMSW